MKTCTNQIASSKHRDMSDNLGFLLHFKERYVQEKTLYDFSTGVKTREQMLKTLNFIRKTRPVGGGLKKFHSNYKEHL